MQRTFLARHGWRRLAVWQQRLGLRENAVQLRANRADLLVQFGHTTFRPEGELFQRSETEWINVVAHLRTGDIALHSNDQLFYRKIAEAVEDAFHFTHAPKRRYLFFYEGDTIKSARTLQDAVSPPSKGYESILTTFPTAQFIGVLDPPTTLWHFLQSDILITSGGSFPYIALQMAQDDLPVALATMP